MTKREGGITAQAALSMFSNRFPLHPLLYSPAIEKQLEKLDTSAH